VVRGFERGFHRPATIPPQRRRQKKKFGGKERKDVTFISSINLEARASIKNCLSLLWALHIIKEKLQENHLNSESLSRIAYVDEMEDMGAIVKDLVDQNSLFIDLVTILTSTPNSTRLFFPIYYGNAELFDQCVENFDVDDDEIDSAFPNKTEMVRHILENYSVDPTVRLLLGRNALEMAAIHADNTEMIDLLLKHENVDIDGRDEQGKTALHFAAHSSNVIAARHLIKMGAKTQPVQQRWPFSTSYGSLLFRRRGDDRPTFSYKGPSSR